MALRTLQLLQREIFKYLILYILFVSAVEADCYSHDGILAQDSKYYTGPELVSCGKRTNNCCLEDQKCGTNLLCTGTDGSLSRQYCADKNWSGCSDLCADVAGAAGTMLTECGDNIYCCGENCPCTNNNLYFVDPETGEVKDASKGSSIEPATWWSVDSSALLASSATSSPPSASSTSNVTTTSEASSAASTSASTSTPTVTGSSALVSVQTTATGSVPTSTAQSTDQPSSSHGLSAGAGAGIGIGCAAAVTGVTALAWLFFRERKKRRSLEAQQVQAPSSNYIGGHRSPNASENTYKETYGQAQQGTTHRNGQQGVSPPPGYGNPQTLEIEGRARYEMS